jgi:outer membrane protein assembly factor BamB
LAEDFPQFRGLTGQGHSRESGLPLTWSETENIVWKTPLPGSGWSSPLIQGEHIWLTTAVDDGRSLRALCLDVSHGQILHNVEVFHKDDPGKIHEKNSHASPTPVLDGDRVYVHFGSHGTACLTTEGEIIWKTRLDYYHRHGPGGSPTLEGDLLIIHCDGFDAQFVVALNKHTGQEVWRVDRDGKHAYSTPLVIDVAGQRQLISVGGEWVFAYDPPTGRILWQVRYPGGYSTIPRPVYGHGLVFLSSGYDKPVFYAIRPTGSGDVTETHVAWTLERGSPLTPSPLLVGDELYLVSDDGILTCVEAATGKAHWRQRLGGNFSASPLYADGRIYLLDENGNSTVVAPNKESYQKLAVNVLPGRTLASPAASAGSLFLRTDAALYRIARKVEGAASH